MANLRKVFKHFDDLTPDELYALLRLRIEVFVVEQNCVFQDLDNKDQQCYHLMLFDDTGEMVACARLVPPGLAYNAMSIGRVVTGAKVRGTGVGKILMLEAIEKCESIFGRGAITIGAQCYAKKFYEQVGFVQSGDKYLEDGIEHIEMTRL